MCKVPRKVIAHVTDYTSDSPSQTRPGTVEPVLVFADASEDEPCSDHTSETRSAQSPPPSTLPKRTLIRSRIRSLRHRDSTVSKVLKTVGRVVKRIVIEVFLDIPLCIVLVTAGAVVFVVSGTVKVAWWVVKTAAQAVGGVVACVVGIVCCPCLTLVYASDFED
jgi:hypothetical protein